MIYPIVIILFIVYLVICMLIAVRIDKKQKHIVPKRKCRVITGLGDSRYNGFGI